ncbi:sulfite exporter TauE/SafE family protein [Aestuariimicrobium soli]|uniref:sulfite exporter TauE/SafE family protein n=1 Tax=Aestuariimicrobium soli TaxID=2035834 RepID=UPI003EBA2C48
MRKLIGLAIVGLIAQLVDGALGMGYGVTSTSLLLIAGLTPAAASASVHLAELGTTLVSGVSHHRFGNVDWKLTVRLGIPGAIGAFLGATVLARLSTEAATPIMSGLLLLLGVYLLSRFVRVAGHAQVIRPGRLHTGFLTPLGLVGGFVDATGGGGWGPVSTTTLLVVGRTKPRTVVGSVDTSEFLVTLFASLGFLIGLGTAGINYGFVLALLLGGLVAAPIAAFLVSRLPAAVLGTGAGVLIVVTNLRTLLKAGGVAADLRTIVLTLVGAVGLLVLGVAVQRHRARVQRENAEAEQLEAELFQASLAEAAAPDEGQEVTAR